MDEKETKWRNEIIKGFNIIIERLTSIEAKLDKIEDLSDSTNDHIEKIRCFTHEIKNYLRWRT